MFAPMHKFNSDGVEIAYEVAGEGPPVLLIHGFASTGRVNWWDTGWVKTLVNAGHKVITFDHRGHGASEKLYDSEHYPAIAMAGGRAPPARSSGNRPSRRDGLLDGGARFGSSRHQPSRSGCAARCSRGWRRA